MEPTIRTIAYASNDYTAMLALREAVLRLPLGLRLTPEQLMPDATDTHFGLVEQGVIVGGVIVSLLGTEHAKIRQMVVAPTHQHGGYGGKLLQHAHDFVRSKNMQHIVLNARETAVPFYEKHGYRIVGEPFTEVTLPHRRMETILG